MSLVLSSVCAQSQPGMSRGKMRHTMAACRRPRWRPRSVRSNDERWKGVHFDCGEDVKGLHARQICLLPFKRGIRHQEMVVGQSAHAAFFKAEEVTYKLRACHAASVKP